MVDSNTISNVRLGINDAAQNSGGNVIPDYFNLFQNNAITNTQTAISVWNSAVSGQIGNVGTVIRDNQINTASLAAILLGDDDAQASPFFVIVQGNTAANLPVGLAMVNDGTAPTYLTLIDNSFSRGSAAAAGSIALDITQNLMLTQTDNTFAGFAQTDGGSVTPTILSPVVAAAGTQFPSTTGLNATTSATPIAGSSSGTTSSGKSKNHTKKQNATTVAAPVEFAAATITTNNLKFNSTAPGNDAAVLSD